jgi:hypothetical protein
VDSWPRPTPVAFGADSEGAERRPTPSEHCRSEANHTAVATRSHRANT